MQLRTNRRSSLSEPVNSQRGRQRVSIPDGFAAFSKAVVFPAGNELVQPAWVALHGARLPLAPHQMIDSSSAIPATASTQHRI